MSYRNIRFNEISHPTRISGDRSEGYYVKMFAVLETYAVSNSQWSTGEELMSKDDIIGYANASSEATALANAQFTLYQELENYKQRRTADLINPSYSSRSSSSSSSSSMELLDLVFILFLILSVVIAIAVMRSSFPSYFPTKNLFPANEGDWLATIFYALIPIPIGWVAWVTGFSFLFICGRILEALFPKK